MLPSTICAPSARTSSGSSVFTVAFVPTGMNTGVRTSPCAVVSTPARAAPSVAVTRTRAQASLLAAHGGRQAGAGRVRADELAPLTARIARGRFDMPRRTLRRPTSRPYAIEPNREIVHVSATEVQPMRDDSSTASRASGAAAQRMSIASPKE